MKIYFLGTGTSQGIPIIGSDHPVCKSTDQRDKRLRSSVWISWNDNYSFVIDCGPDFRQQMLRSECQKLDGILYTHEHSDHIMGLDDIRPFNLKTNNKSVPIYAHKRVLAELQKRFEYIFQKENRYPGAPSVEAVEVVNNKPFLLGNKTTIPINSKHGEIQVFGYRIDDFAYLTDIKSIENKELEKLKNIKILVINALQQESHPTHLNLKEALNLVSIIKPQKAYLTHISHKLGFHKEVQAKLPENIFLAYDNLEVFV